VLRAQLPDRGVFLKVMQPHKAGEIVQRHQHLLSAGVPVPRVIAEKDGLVVLEELPGRPLSAAVVQEGVDACTAEDLVALLDRMPASMYSLPLRPPWTESIDFYAGIVSSAMPPLGPRLDSLVREIREGLAAVGKRLDMSPHDVVHGDFYEAQVFVQDGHVVGLLDIDTVGPGRRADDLACLLAHLSVLADYGNTGRIDQTIQRRVEEAVVQWQQAFGHRVDPTELALRCAGVVLSLATGPHRQQESAWQAATEAIVRVAERWVDVAKRAEQQRLRPMQQQVPQPPRSPHLQTPIPSRSPDPRQGPNGGQGQAPPASHDGNANDDRPTQERWIGSVPAR
jgi:aminoglycoside phosphotransferase